MRKWLSLAATITFLAAFCVSTLPAAEVEEGFVSLFNGQDLTGWVKHGGSGTYHVEDETIVGETVPDTPHNTFLCTDKEYGDFILKLEFMMEIPMDSGIQFRSHVTPAGDIMHLYGYQSQIDAHLNQDMGRLYDEGRRGFQHGIIWMTDETPEQKEKLYPLAMNEWHTMEIQCVGPSIRTWVNGVAMTNTFDDFDLSGIIGLQVHCGGPGKIRWRNIRIKDLGKTEWKSFFITGEDGKMKLADARFVLPDDWAFDDEKGMLVGNHQPSEGRDGLVVSDANYTDLVTRVTYLIFGGNSGLYFRAEEIDVPHLLRGFQNEIAGNARDSALWDTGGRGWVAFNDDLVGKAMKPNDWNTIMTAAYGDRIIDKINGFTTFDILDPECHKTGKVGLQLHGGTEMKIWFKDFQVIEFTEEMKALIDRE